MVNIDRRCAREIEDFPLSVREDLADAIARLELGHTLSMPLSRPMPSIGRGVHELRLRDQAGAYRVVYVLASRIGVYVIAAFKKTSEQTLKRYLDVARKRLKELGL